MQTSGARSDNRGYRIEKNGIPTLRYGCNNFMLLHILHQINLAVYAVVKESASVRSALQVEVDESRALVAKVQQEMNAMQVNRARFMTGGGYRLLASANFGELVLGCIEAKCCK